MLCCPLRKHKEVTRILLWFGVHAEGFPWTNLLARIQEAATYMVKEFMTADIPSRVPIAMIMGMI